MKGNVLCGGWRFPLNDFCLSCKHYNKNTLCDAFPNGIPEDMWTGKINHENNVEGDHGIKFEQAEDVFIDEDIVLIDEEW